ncbi:MAG: hypothetical protein RMK18_03235 [Armatimonadota bacterium]|nr:hypothetical protein [Armatimonadota bacterium]MCX7777066.1 hypothetical protein [Armatimonadota bacterium]MDW8024864.1 hypothetical protein [Armatimonadota bacterium]
MLKTSSYMTPLTLILLMALGNLQAQLEKPIEEARQLAADGKLNEAVTLLHEAAKQQEHIWHSHILKLEALKLYQAAGKLNERLKVMLSALSQRPYESELLWMTAQAYWLTGETWEALCYLTRAVGAAPSVGAYYAWLGKAYMELGMEYHADAAFELAVRLDPTLFWVVRELRRSQVKVTQPEVKPPTQLPIQPEQPKLPEQPKQPEPPKQPEQPKQPELPKQPTPPKPPAQRLYQADIAPNGAIVRFSFRGQLCFINFGFRVAPPGWGWPPLFRQVDMQPVDVKREERDGVITISGTAKSPAGDSIQWVQTITQTNEALEVTYELTALKDIKVESVLIEAWIPTASVADPGRWFIIAGGKPDLKPFPEKPPQGPSPVFFTSNTLEPVGWITREGAGVLITMEKQPGAFWWLQDDRLYGIGFFEFQFHCGIRNLWRRGQTATFALTVRPFAAEGAQ